MYKSTKKRKRKSGKMKNESPLFFSLEEKRAAAASSHCASEKGHSLKKQEAASPYPKLKQAEFLAPPSSCSPFPPQQMKVNKASNNRRLP